MSTNSHAARNYYKGLRDARHEFESEMTKPAPFEAHLNEYLSRSDVSEHPLHETIEKAALKRDKARQTVVEVLAAYDSAIRTAVGLVGTACDEEVWPEKRPGLPVSLSCD